MPLYEYQCKKCRHRFEKIQLFSDKPTKKCPECGGPVEKLLSAPAVQFKGTGWYATDYAKKSAPSASTSDGSDSGSKSGDSGGDSKSADSASKSEKSDSKESKSDSKSKPEGSGKKSHKK